MEEKVIKPAGYGVKYGWLWFGVIFIILIGITVSIILQGWDLVSIVLFPSSCLATLAELLFMLYMPVRKKIVFDKDGKFVSYVRNKGKFKKVDIPCKNITKINVKKNSLEVKPYLTTKDDFSFALGQEIYSKSQLREIIQEIQKRGGLKDYKIDF